MIYGIHHVAITVDDLDRAVAFYTSTLGFREVLRESWASSEELDRLLGLEESAGRAVTLYAANVFFELFEYDSPPPREERSLRAANEHGFSHLALEVDDVWKEYERLSALGMRFHCEPQDLGESVVAFGRDPFGNIIELQETRLAGYPSIAPGYSFAALPERRYD